MSSSTTPQEPTAQEELPLYKEVARYETLQSIKVALDMSNLSTFVKEAILKNVIMHTEARERAAYNRGREVERAATKIFTDAKVRAAEERLLDEVEEKMSYASVHSVNINDYEGYMGEFISLTRQALKEKRVGQQSNQLLSKENPNG